MFWDNVAWLYDIFADGINRKANRALCAAVGELISPADDVLECACGTGLLTTVIAPRCKRLTATDFSDIEHALRVLSKLMHLTARQSMCLQNNR